MDHQNIVKLIKKFDNEEENTMSFVAEYLPESLKDRKQIDSIRLKIYIYQMI